MTADLKVSGGKTSRFRLTELSFKRLVAAGVTRDFWQRSLHRRDMACRPTSSPFM